ncbi:hypothetical protein [Intestinibacter bartlettii]|uniref:Uncharacterized protein n=1 Tax=Intestinibacter bartlettii CAG:1329 TaxID=1263063 RepID=R5XS83_9FIRM|nr:hypothetical protein [Intestinibacter bartlettii]CDA11641.1 uncharacterized protein BN488_02599 [Intestinibacter bartlettii CAG:1329]
MNNLLLILGLLALSNGNVSLFGNKNKNVSNESLKIDKKDTKKLVQKTKKSSRDNENKNNKNNQSRKLSSSLNSNTKKIKKIKKIRKNSKHKNRKLDNPIQYNVDDIKAGIKLMDLSEEDLDRGMEIITRTKKYMSSEERKMLIKMESILDLVKGIKKLNDVDILEKEDESEFFRNMDEEDKKNMMIKEILEVFPEKRKESVEKAIDMKKKIDLFAELFLPEDGEGGFSLSSLADISNLGSSNNIKLLGSLLRGDNLESDEDNDEIEEYDEEYNEDDYQYGEYYEEYENGYNKNRYD